MPSNEFIAARISKWTPTKPKGPVTLEIYPTLRCNLDCSFCDTTDRHRPPMNELSTETWLQIIDEAADRWPLLAASVVHRVGRLSPGDQIVWVGVASTHREAAFSACEFIMDYLKTRAPFWKKELGPFGEIWVSARQDDESRAARWQDDSTP